jgi:mannose-6-phosphate isomerase class I
MKNSDNVCRLGLTPKYKDLDVIGEVLGSNFSTVIPI